MSDDFSYTTVEPTREDRVLVLAQAYATLTGIAVTSNIGDALSAISAAIVRLLKPRPHLAGRP